MGDLILILGATAGFMACAVAFSAYRRSLVGLSSFVLGYAVFAQMLLTELKVGGMSPKVPTVAVAFALAARRLLSEASARRRVILALPIITPLLLLALWIPLHNMFAGTLDEELLARVASDQAMALMVLIAILGLVRGRQDAQFLVWTSTIALTVSTFVAFLQFFGVTEAWELHSRLRPLSLLARPRPDLLIAPGSVPGLAATSIQEAYFALSLGGFGFAHFLIGSRHALLLRAMSLLSFAGLCTIVFLARSRSGMWLMLLLSASLFLYLPARYRNVRWGRALVFAVVSVVALASVFLVVQRSDEFQQADLSKMERIADADRFTLALGAIEELARAPFIGMGPEAFLDKYGLVAHNSVLNAGTYYGIVGILLLIWFWYGLFRLWRIWMNQSWATPSSWIAVGGFFGVMGYNLNGMLHNESVITGGILGAIPVGIWLCGAELERIEANRRPDAVAWRVPAQQSATRRDTSRARRVGDVRAAASSLVRGGSRSTSL